MNGLVAISPSSSISLTLPKQPLHSTCRCSSRFIQRIGFVSQRHVGQWLYMRSNSAVFTARWLRTVRVLFRALQWAKKKENWNSCAPSTVTVTLSSFAFPVWTHRVHLKRKLWPSQMSYGAEVPITMYRQTLTCGEAGKLLAGSGPIYSVQFRRLLVVMDC